MEVSQIITAPFDVKEDLIRDKEIISNSPQLKKIIDQEWPLNLVENKRLSGSANIGAIFYSLHLKKNKKKTGF